MGYPNGVLTTTPNADVHSLVSLFYFFFIVAKWTNKNGVPNILQEQTARQ